MINEKENNIIKIIIKIEKGDINKYIYFLDNTEGNYYNENDNLVEHHHDNLKELNELNTELFINNIKYKYEKYFKLDKEGTYEIKLKFKIYIKDCSFMFCDCSKITNIDLSSFDTNYVTNMSYMFFCCSKLTDINLSSFDTKNVTNMKGMFGDCSNLERIDLSSFDTKNVTNMNYMFQYCSKLKSIKINNIESNINLKKKFLLISRN